MAELNFGGINVTVNTVIQEMLFSWMLHHNDVQEFRIDNTYFELLEHNYNTAVVEAVSESGTSKVIIDHPYEWKFKDHATGDVSFSDPEEFTLVNKKGEILIGVNFGAQNYLKFKVNNNFELEDVSMSNRIYPDINPIGIDEDGFYIYDISFSTDESLTLYYCIENPIDSYVLEK